LRMPLHMGFTHHNAAEANFSMNLNIHWLWRVQGGLLWLGENL
jgi:hypothetical protein